MSVFPRGNDLFCPGAIRIASRRYGWRLLSCIFPESANKQYDTGNEGLLCKTADKAAAQRCPDSVGVRFAGAGLQQLVLLFHFLINKGGYLPDHVAAGEHPVAVIARPGAALDNADQGIWVAVARFITSNEDPHVAA